MHFLESNAPTVSKNLKQQRVGVGSSLNFYPINADIEIGKGIKLNDKYYLSTALNYQLNQHWQFSLNGNLNGSATPIKAIEQKIYTKDFGFSTTYTHSDKFQTGLGANLMKFDDSNLRKSFFAWANLETYKKDRWALSNSLRFDYQRNKEISTANYYNPRYSKNIEVGMDLSYLQPMNNGLILTHHLRATTGLYSQSNASNENSWSISYGNEWRIGKKMGISYAIGRKKNIYDGAAEFNNFGNLNLSIYF